MRSAIVAIGTELLFGHTVNTNAAYLSQELNELGIDVVYHYTMGDNPERLKRIIGIAEEDCNLIIFTGGLGPTEDDLTKEVVCEYLGQEMVYMQEVEDRIRRQFDKLNLELSPNNRKQCYFPKHGTMFRNDAGTAPGFAVRKNNRIYACLPGVPHEMETMWKGYLRPYLEKFEDAAIVSRRVELFGMGESLVETKLLDLIEQQTDPTLATYAKEGNVEIRITSKRSTEAEASNAVERMTRAVLERVGDFVYSVDGEPLFQYAADRLMERNITLSCAEGPTAGLFAAELVRVPGISSVFDRGYIVYGDRSLVEDMGISPDFLAEYTSCSAEMAEELVKKVYEKTHSDLCISVTGAAGPEDRPGCKAGTFHISLYYKGEILTRSFVHSRWNRRLTRNLMAQTMFNMIVYTIEGRKMPGMK